MRLLAIGDFHGKVPKRLKKFCKKNKIDYILSSGDFMDVTKTRRLLIFKYLNQKKEWWEIIGLKKAKEIIKKEIKTTKKALKILDSINIPIYIIPGNAEPLNKTRFGQDTYYNLIKPHKNFIDAHKKIIFINNYQILGFGGYGPKPETTVKIYGKKFTKKMKIRIEKKKQKLHKLFKKINPERTIFFIHDAPYNTKLDVVRYPSSPAKGKHVGDSILRKFIEKYQPFLCICGHMHEYQNYCFIGRTLVVNPVMAEKERLL